MDLRKEYNKFYNMSFAKASLVEIKYLKLLKKKLNDLISAQKDYNYEDLLLALEEEIKSISSLKANYLNIYYKFLDYLKKQNVTFKSGLPKNYLTETRRLELIKYFHKPHTEKEVLDNFMINNRTFRSDLKALEEGVEFCGCILKIKFNKYDRGGKITIDDIGYHSSYNPFGLVLNMSELYLLTNIVPKMIKNSYIRGEYSNIMNKIYPQLSEYALDLIKIDYKGDDYGPNNPFVLESETMKKSKKNQILYVLKTGKSCTVIYDTAEGSKKTQGYIHYDCGNSFTVEKENGEKQEIMFDDFVAIENFFEDIYG